MPNRNTLPAILLCGHGSRDTEAVDEFYQLAAQVKSRFPDRLCEVGFLEFTKPVIAEGAAKLVAQGARHVLALPAMLMAGGHIKNDIPIEIHTLNLLYKAQGVSFHCGVALGVHPKMIQAAIARIQESENNFGDDYQRKACLLVVVGRGASDSDVNSNISKIARMLEEDMGFGASVTCFSGTTTPLVDEALRRYHGLGFKRVIVFPYFLFTGQLVKKIYAWADEYAAAHPEVEVAKAPYLSNHPLVIDAFIERMEEAKNSGP